MKKIKTVKNSGNLKLLYELSQVAYPRFNTGIIIQKAEENQILAETLKEARDQLAQVNEYEVNASTNVVLKRIDKVLKWWGNL